MINLYNLSIYIITVVSIVATPGPVVLLIINASANHGFSNGLKTILGTNFASLVLMVIASSAVMGLLTINENVINGIGLLGALYLLYLAINYLILGYKMHSTKYQLDKKAHGGFKQGFLTAISNPKDIIFFAALFPQFVNISNSQIASLSILCFVWCLLDWIILLVFTVLSIKIFTHENATKYITIISSLLIGSISIIGLVKYLKIFFA